MKNYIKNKGFIPDQFITKIQDKNLKSEKKIIFILLCLNLIYLPFNIDLLSKSNNVNVEKTDIKSYSEKGSIDSEKIYGIAEILFSDVVKECDVTNDGGSLIVGSVEEADVISGKKVFNVEEAELEDDGNFELRVDSYEENIH